MTSPRSLRLHLAQLGLPPRSVAVITDNGQGGFDAKGAAPASVWVNNIKRRGHPVSPNYKR